MARLAVSAGGFSSTIKVKRPRYSDLWNAYAEVGHMDSGAVFERVGGEAAALRKQNPDDYENACALRMSRAFNYGGYKIPSGTIFEDKNIYRVSGSDGMPYILRVNQMITYLKYKWGTPDLVMLPGKDKEILNKKGLIIVEVSGWTGASGHAVLWNGENTGDGSDYHLQESQTWQNPKLHL